MKKFLDRLGFTLVEVNLAIFIMAVGVLAMVAIYPLGYRENLQSVDDVRAAAFADAIMNQIAGVLSSRNLTWQEWRQSVEGAIEQEGWGGYCESGRGYTPRKSGECNSKATKAFNALTKYKNKAGGNATWPLDSDLTCAIVVQWGVTVVPGSGWQRDYSRCAVSLRVSRNAGSLFSQPLFYTEIHFQGDQEGPNVSKNKK